MILKLNPNTGYYLVFMILHVLQKMLGKCLTELVQLRRWFQEEICWRLYRLALQVQRHCLSRAEICSYNCVLCGKQQFSGAWLNCFFRLQLRVNSFAVCFRTRCGTRSSPRRSKERGQTRRNLGLGQKGRRTGASRADSSSSVSARVL